MQNCTTQLNALSTSKFKMVINKLPSVEFWMQSASIPSIALEGGIFSAPNRDIPVSGHKITYEMLNVTFIVDQLLENYTSVYDWLLETQQAENYFDSTSEISIMLLDGDFNGVRSINYHNCSPASLSTIDFTVNEDSPTPVMCTLGIRYSTFNISSATQSLVQ